MGSVQKSSALVAARLRTDQTQVESGFESGIAMPREILTEQPSQPSREPNPPIDDRAASQLVHQLGESLKHASTEHAAQFEVELRAARIREQTPTGPLQERDVLLARASATSPAGHPLVSKTTWLDQPVPAWPAGFVGSFDRAVAETRLPAVASPALERLRFVLDAGVHAAIARMVVAAVIKGIVKPGHLASSLVGLTDSLPLGAGSGWRDRRGRAIGELQLIEAGRWVSEPDEWAWPVDSWREPARPGARQLRWTGSAAITAWPEKTWVVTRAIYVKSAALVFGIGLDGGIPVGRFGPILVEQPWLWWFRVAAVLTLPVRDASDLPTLVPAVWLER